MRTLLQVIKIFGEIQLQDYGKKIVQQLDKKIKGGNGSCASNNSGVFSQMERDPSTAGPSGSDQGWESGCAQRKVSGSRIRNTNKSARLSFAGHIQFLSEQSGVLT